MNGNEQIKDVVAFLAGDENVLLEYDVEEWLSFCKLLARHDLLICNADKLLSLAPKLVKVRLLQAKKVHFDSMERRLAALSALAEKAAEEHLRFAIIKGLALSQELFGSEFLRQSGDIDILVAHDDIPKADYVARKAGWFQPAEAFRVRRAVNDGKTNAMLQESQSPYPLRSSPFLPHVSNYFLCEKTGQVESLEIHDRFYGLDGSITAALILNPRRVKLGGRSYMTLSRPAHALLSCLSLHEDTVSVRANIIPDETLGLKTCCDVYKWLHVLSHEELLKLRELAKAVSVDRLVAQGLGVCCEVFPNIVDKVRIVAEPLPNPWGLSYVDRLTDRKNAADSCVYEALAAFFKAAEEEKIVCCRDGVWHRLPSADGALLSGFEFRSYRGSESVHLTWKIPGGFQSSDVALQTVFVGAADNGEANAVRVEVFVENKRWTANAESISSRSFDFHVGMMREPTDLFVESLPSGSGGFKIEIEVPNKVAPFGEFYTLPSVHLRNRASLFSICAGSSLVDVTGKALYG